MNPNLLNDFFVFSWLLIEKLRKTATNFLTTIWSKAWMWKNWNNLTITIVYVDIFRSIITVGKIVVWYKTLWKIHNNKDLLSFNFHFFISSGFFFENWFGTFQKYVLINKIIGRILGWNLFTLNRSFCYISTESNSIKKY